MQEEDGSCLTVQNVITQKKSSEFVILFLCLSQMLTLNTLSQNLFRNCYDHKLEPGLCTQYTD